MSKIEGIKITVDLDPLTRDELESMYELGELPEGIYSAVNEDKEKVVVMVDSDKGFDIHTLQSNGWVRIDYHDYDGVEWTRGESYKGKWRD